MHFDQGSYDCADEQAHDGVHRSQNADAFKASCRWLTERLFELVVYLVAEISHLILNN